MTGRIASGLICFAVGRSVARPGGGGRRRGRSSPRFARSGRCRTSGRAEADPDPAAGAARVPTWRFIWTTTLGFLPITAVTVFLGSRIEELSLTDPFVLASVIVLLVLLLGGHWAMRRQASRSGP
jgi:hypothetical protein